MLNEWRVVIDDFVSNERIICSCCGKLRYSGATFKVRFAEVNMVDIG